ncbi:MAG: glycosyltransferase family 2 protein [Candidatus Nealsonbacteria bacterium]|nr:glycosyltransferase family 2 protein [Candidatus Nealsonbacteria bacterium]
MKDLTIVVCAKNSEGLMENCLREIKRNTPESELIVVDADSTDRTAEIARQYADKVVSDHRQGLSVARQLGIDEASNDFVAFISPDNVLSRETLEKLMEALKRDEKIAGVQPVTVLKNPKSYWEKSTKEIFELLLNSVGPVDVIGTPCIFRKKIVSVLRYDPEITKGADDTALCLKLINAGFKLERVNAVSFEEQRLNFRDFFARWKFYGQGDAQFYRKYSPTWKFPRKLKSLFHPFRKYVWRGFWTSLKKGKIALWPALLVAVFARYYGWWRAK